MKKKSAIITLAITLVLVLASYRFGIKVTTEEYSNALGETQAILAFNHMQRYKKILKCLNNKKPSEAAEKLKMDIVTEKELIANYLSENESESVSKYISLRTKETLEDLKNFKSNRGQSWREPSCK